MSSTQHNTWINDIGLLLLEDADGDGYARGLSLRLDVDTTSPAHTVIADIKLHDQHGTLMLDWLTRDFTVQGRAWSEDYVVDIQLEESYPTDDYSLEITLYDSYSGDWVDFVNAHTHAALGGLPLESADLDAPTHHHPETVHYPALDKHSESGAVMASGTVVVGEYAGASTLITALVLGMTLFRRLSRAMSARANRPGAALR